ncbi:MAG: YggS family pyridoxal phosphate enzyme [Actinomycetes bacterium]
MVEQLTDVDPDRVRANLAALAERVAEAAAVSGRSPEAVEILAATKYVAAEAMGALAEAGVTLVGENRAQDLAAKQEIHGDRFTWDFIGDLQSRKIPQLVGRVRLIHSVASESALAKLARPEAAGQRILVQVNLSGEESKGGIEPADLAGFIERAPCPVVGLMTMPPLAETPEANRRYFAQLRELASENALEHLSMGTSQDFEVAVEEGATIVRIGAILCR